MKTVFAACLFAAVLTPMAAAADAQTYDLDIVIASPTGFGPGEASPPWTFSGTFTFNPAGSGFCSAAFCGAGVTPQFSNISITDPLGFGVFTDAVGSQAASGAQLNFFDTLTGVPGKSSDVYELSFATNAPLGSSETNIGLSDISFSLDANGTGTVECGAGSTRCPTASLIEVAPSSASPAPEIDPRSALSAVTLLLGALLVLRGRRSAV